MNLSMNLQGWNMSVLHKPALSRFTQSSGALFQEGYYFRRHELQVQSRIKFIGQYSITQILTPPRMKQVL